MFIKTKTLTVTILLFSACQLQADIDVSGPWTFEYEELHNYDYSVWTRTWPDEYVWDEKYEDYNLGKGVCNGFVTQSDGTLEGYIDMNDGRHNLTGTISSSGEISCTVVLPGGSKFYSGINKDGQYFECLSVYTDNVTNVTGTYDVARGVIEGTYEGGQEPYSETYRFYDSEGMLSAICTKDIIDFHYSGVFTVRISKPPIASLKSLNVINLGDPENEETSEGYHMVGGVIRFDASDSNDPDGGEIQNYYWDFDGGDFQRLNSPDQKPDIVFKEAKVYKITLVVVDDEGTPSEPYTETLDLTLQEGDLIFLRSAGWSVAFDLIDNFYTHVGMYIGNQQMIESIAFTNPRSPKRRGVVITPISGWSYPSETYATLMRVRTANSETIKDAIVFARRRYDDREQYDLRLWQKSLLQRNYYCSELIWAAYFVASDGDINLGLKQTGDLWDWFIPVSPDDIVLHDNVNFGELIGFHWENIP
jgi:PKD repeat protein